MRWGSPWSAGWGAPENHFVYVVPDYYGAAVSGNLYMPFTMLLRPGLDDAYVSIYRNAQWQKNVYMKASPPYVGLVDMPWGGGAMDLLPLRIGHLADPSYKDEKVARTFETTTNTRATLQFTFTPKAIVPPLSDGGYTSAWSVSGAVLGQNCANVRDQASWGRLGLTITVSGGNVTIALDMNGTIVASGTTPVLGAPFPISLTGQNNSGLSLSCTVSNTVANVSGGTMDIRWPLSVQILRDTFSPPTTVRDSVIFRGKNTERWTEPADLGSGTYYYATVPVSDTGVSGTQSAAVSVTTQVPPAPPTNIAYSSGTAGGGVVLSFTGSATAGATYRAYLTTVIGGVINLNDIKATAIAGASSITLPAITGYPGTCYVILRAFVGGIEDQNVNILALEFDSSGNIVLPRPNQPVIRSFTVSGRTMTVTGIYNKDHQLGIATVLRLYVRTPTGAYAQVGTGGTLGAAGNPNLQTGTVTWTAPADGYYYAILVAETAGGLQSKQNTSNEQLILVSNDVLPAAGSVSVALSRS